MLKTVPHSKCSVSDKHVFAGAHITGAINNQPRQQAERMGSETSETFLSHLATDFFIFIHFFGYSIQSYDLNTIYILMTRIYIIHSLRIIISSDIFTISTGKSDWPSRSSLYTCSSVRLSHPLFQDKNLSIILHLSVSPIPYSCLSKVPDVCTFKIWQNATTPNHLYHLCSYYQVQRTGIRLPDSCNSLTPDFHASTLVPLQSNLSKLTGLIMQVRRCHFPAQNILMAFHFTQIKNCVLCCSKPICPRDLAIAGSLTLCLLCFAPRHHWLHLGYASLFLTCEPLGLCADGLQGPEALVPRYSHC